MGLYAYITEQDRIDKRKVEDPYINEAFQEALKYRPDLMIECYHSARRVRKFLFFHVWEPYIYYNLYHETPAFDGSAYQMRYQSSGSGSREIIIAYLHGIINGNNKTR